VAGERAEFRLFVRDSTGSPADVSTADVCITCDDPRVPTRVNASGERGEVLVEYVAKAPGALQICIAICDEGMPQSWSPVVCPGPAFPEESVAVGSGMHEAEASTASSFYLLAHDKCGNRILTGGARFYARLLRLDSSAESATKVAVRDEGDGSYTCEYTASVPGVHEIHVILQTQYLRRSQTQMPTP
jgi:hypothetical protein